MRFRPCIDLHDGKVKQIVGGTLSESSPQALRTNFEADTPPEWFAELYKKDGLTGGHVIQLGSGNRSAARAALAAWPGGLQIGGGIALENAAEWLDAGAACVIVTSWAFHDGVVDMERIKRLSSAIGKDRLVLDLSCRLKDDTYWVVTDRWQTFTRESVNPSLLGRLAPYCCEFLVHGVDVEGKCAGIETRLVEILGSWGSLPMTYAGGIRTFEDIEAIGSLGKGIIDFTVGSALDIFGGAYLSYQEIVRRYAS